MDNGCYITNCPAIKSQTPAVKNQCLVPDTVKENTEGCMNNPSPPISTDEVC